MLARVSVWACLVLFIALAYANCFGFSGTRQSEQVERSSMATCCWMNNDTCCAYNGTAVGNLTDIQYSLRNLVAQGLSEQCYLQLANLECSLCAPDQTSFIYYAGTIDGDDTDQAFDNQKWYIRICASFCDSIYSACSNPEDTLLLGTTNAGTSRNFCENMNGNTLENSDEYLTSIFGGAQFVVSEFSCFAGSPQADVNAAVGVCLTSHDNLLVEIDALTPSSSGNQLLVGAMIFALLAVLL